MLVMPNIQLKIRHQEVSQHATAAWFVHGDTSEAWLAEIERWAVAHEDLCLIPVAQTKPNHSPNLSPNHSPNLSPNPARKLIGALVYISHFAEKAATDELPRATNALNYGCLCDRFYLPCNGALHPQLTQDELEDLLTPDNVYVWHPAVGLMVAGPSEVFSISDLLTAIPPKHARWEHARQGLFLETRLRSLSLERQADLTPESVFKDGQDDIGGQIENLKDLAPSPDEPSPNPTGPIANVSEAFFQSFAKMIQKGTHWVPAHADHPTWINGIENWATEKLNGISQRLEKERYKELYRLQKLLKDDPDQGLKYALPLNSDSLHRGLASPASTLGRRNVDFSLSGLRGGGSADFWDVPQELRNELTNQYRELAVREARLGRHRRAAYIYGELLSDMNAAARTLETGKHYREAAVIFRKKLNRDDEAARCLEHGGLWTEAIELHDELKNFEKSGDLYAKLDNHEQARASYQAACEQANDRRDFLEAARIEKDKLDDSDAAIKTLKRGWPEHPQAVECLKKSFQLMGSDGKHESAKQWLTEVVEGRLPKKHLNQTVKEISELANNYPDQATRDLATEKTYQIVSQTIENGRLPDLNSLLSSVARLHPNDELLQRDCQRFRLNRFETASKVKAKSNQNTAGREIEMMRAVKLQKNFQWCNAIAFGGGFLAVGKENRKAKVVQLSAAIEQMAEFTSALSSNTTEDFLLANGNGRLNAVVHLSGDRRFASRQLSAHQSMDQLKDDQSLSLDANTVGITEGGFGQWQILRFQNHQLLLDTVATNGDLVNSQIVPFQPQLHESQIPIPMFNDADMLFIAMGTLLLTSKGSSPMEVLKLPEPAVGMAGSIRRASTRVALSFEYGFRVLWKAYDSDLSVLMSDTLYKPKLLFTSAGYLIAADDDQCVVYRSTAGKFEWLGKVEINGCRALMRTGNSSGFALLNDAGEIEIYRF